MLPAIRYFIGVTIGAVTGSVYFSLVRLRPEPKNSEPISVRFVFGAVHHGAAVCGCKRTAPLAALECRNAIKNCKFLKYLELTDFKFSH